MKIICEKIEYKSYSTECEVDSYCCRKMRHALEETKKKHKDGSGHEQKNLFRITECGIEVATKMDDGCFSSSYPEDYENIFFCPWCGKEIE